MQRFYENTTPKFINPLAKVTSTETAKTEVLQFRTNVIDAYQSAIDHFQWGTVYYCADLSGKIFFAYKNEYDSKLEFPKNGRITYLPKNRVHFYNIANCDIDVNKFHNYAELKNGLMKKSIYESTKQPSLLKDYNDKNYCNEILNCFDFVSYIFVQAFRSKVKEYNYYALLEKINPIVKLYFNEVNLTLPSLSFLTKNSSITNIKPGDLLFFSMKVENKLICKHVGFYNGYDEDNKPQICDLWNRENSSSVKNVKFMSCDAYTQFTITTVPLEKLYLELCKVLSNDFQPLQTPSNYRI